MSTFDILAVSSRRLCGENFLARMERVAAARPAGILLREKDLPEEAYEALARAVMDLCRGYGVPCILHTFLGAAERLGLPGRPPAPRRPAGKRGAAGRV